MFRRVNDEGAPATTNVEQTLAWAQAQFAADVIKLLLLSDIEVVARRVEVRARIQHLAIQPEAIKIIRNIVVERYRAPNTLR